MVYFLYSMVEETRFEFEFDEQKSRTNQDKHGIDFVQAQQLWLDPDRVQTPARSRHEPRFLVVGLISDLYWSAFITFRDQRIRLISVRRSRRKEVPAHGQVHGC